MDVAIIGAGLAGLTAARILAERGVEVELFEASDRIGGRARTIIDHHGLLPVELGPEFVHGRVEPTLQLVREIGLSLDPITDDGMFARIAKLLGNVGERDESARAYLDRAGLSGDDAALFASFVEGFYGAPLDDISVASIAGDASNPGGEGASQARIEGGYGELARWLAARLARANVPVHHRRFVRTVDYSGERVRLDFRGFQAVADRAIVTLPIGVLQAPGVVTFRPELGDHAVAISRLAMGQVVKIVICMREPVWRDRLAGEFVRAPGDFPTYWVRSSSGAHQLTAWAGGPHATALAGVSPLQLADRALDGFAAATGIPRERLDAAVRDHHCHDFGSDPFARGAYSYTRVGGVGAADVLANPVADKLFFAGEATDRDTEGTVAGALASGARAANQILRRLTAGAA
jgi:monoamine oxidase